MTKELSMELEDWERLVERIGRRGFWKACGRVDQGNRVSK